MCDSEENIPKIVDYMPRFPGCEEIGNMDERKKCSREKRLEFINKNIRYPKGLQSSIEGTVVVRFVVTKDGSLNDYKILRSLGGGTDEEVLKVLKLMPKWIPGKHKGEISPVYYIMPVKFRL